MAFFDRRNSKSGEHLATVISRLNLLPPKPPHLNKLKPPLNLFARPLANSTKNSVRKDFKFEPK